MKKRFEETAKFEQEIDTPNLEPKPEQKQARKSMITSKSLTRGVNEDKQFQKYMMA